MSQETVDASDPPTKRHRKGWMPAIVAVSLLINGAFVADHVRRGTFRRLFVRMDVVPAPVSNSAYQDAMEDRYRKLPGSPGAVVFAGDSLIYFGPWSEFYGTVLNRGIPGETSAQLLGRLGELTRMKPRAMVLLTGANDLNQGVPVAQLVRNYRSILERLRKDSPEADVSVLGLLPVDPTIPGAPRFDNPSVLEANRQLEPLIREFPGTRFLDLTSRLADDSGRLRREFTEDGLHLTIDGYLAVRDAVRSLIDLPSDHPTEPR